MDKWSGYPAARDRLLNVDREARAESHGRHHRRHSLQLGERAARRLRAPRPPRRRRGVRGHEHHVGRRRHRSHERRATPGDDERESAHQVAEQPARLRRRAPSTAMTWNTEYKTVAYVSKPSARRDADEVARRARAAGHHETVIAGAVPERSDLDRAIGITRASVAVAKVLDPSPTRVHCRDRSRYSSRSATIGSTRAARDAGHDAREHARRQAARRRQPRT